MPGQTVQSQIRLLAIPYALFGLITLMVEPHSSDFRVISTNFSGVRIFRKSTVVNDVTQIHKYQVFFFYLETLRFRRKLRNRNGRINLKGQRRKTYWYVGQ